MTDRAMHRARTNAARHKIVRIRRLDFSRACRAGTQCSHWAAFLASSPSFKEKPMCEKHGGQWAKRHGIEAP